ncbi:hypothetical protein NPIL_455001 [Nephila pilipes]|uniref:Uncharacterized protein n=1 Tax=Nephila pilipes TaxID=299642 RepID=A0A8X6Q916_NEPPI|nr:hypothetical protein NPIL_455001 [Nephila pilipes]
MPLTRFSELYLEAEDDKIPKCNKYKEIGVYVSILLLIVPGKLTSNLVRLPQKYVPLFFLSVFPTKALLPMEASAFLFRHPLQRINSTRLTSTKRKNIHPRRRISISEITYFGKMRREKLTKTIDKDRKKCG